MTGYVRSAQFPWQRQKVTMRVTNSTPDRPRRRRRLRTKFMTPTQALNQARNGLGYYVSPHKYVPEKQQKITRRKRGGKNYRRKEESSGRSDARAVTP